MASVREYAILYVRGTRTGGVVVGGGNAVLNTGQHAIDGPEHTGQLDHGALAGLADDDHAAYALVNEGGLEMLHAHGNAGATETIDPTLGNYHTLTLDADCTLTLGAPSESSVLSRIEIWATQDGTGGRDLTWPGSVTWIGGTPAPDTTGGTTTGYVLWTTNGGGAWVGVMVGAGGSVGALDDLSDVAITSPTDHQQLAYDGTSWLNSSAHWKYLLDSATGTIVIDGGTGAGIEAWE